MEEEKEALAKHLNEYYDLEFIEANDIECVKKNCFEGDCNCYMYKGCKRGYVYLIRIADKYDKDEEIVKGFVDNKLHKYCINGKCFIVGRVQ